MSSSLLSDLVDFNPPRQLERGEKAKFVEMASLPIAARNVERIQVKEYKGSGSRFRNGDTLLARITPCLENGKTAKMNGLEKGEHAFGSTEFIVLAAKDAAIDEDFLYYLARHPSFRSFAIARMEGTSGRQRVSWQSVSGFRFCFPSPNVRKTAGDILRGLDDKIELNRRMNRTLEAMAQAIFKSWFVDFEPVKAKAAAKAAGASPEEIERAAMTAIAGKTEAELDQLPDRQQQSLAKTAALFPDAFQDSEIGEIPEGWEPKPFSNICEINPRRTLKKNSVATYLDMKSVTIEGPSPSGTIQREFKSGTKFMNGDTLLARITPCLENGKTAFVDFLEENETGWGSTEFVVIRPKDELPLSLGYFFARSDELRSHAIQSMVGTSGRQRVSKDAFDHLSIPTPIDSALYCQFGKFAETVMKAIRCNSNQSRTLAKLRDTLSPKLLSGELSVSELESAESLAL